MTKEAQTQFKNAVRDGIQESFSKMTDEQIKRMSNSFFMTADEKEAMEKERLIIQNEKAEYETSIY